MPRSPGKGRQPSQPAIIHSDQGSQFSCHDWQAFLKPHNLVASMSRRGNCHDNAVVAPQNLPGSGRGKARRVRYIEMFYNPKRRHSYSERSGGPNYRPPDTYFTC